MTSLGGEIVKEINLLPSARDNYFVVRILEKIKLKFLNLCKIDRMKEKSNQ